MASSKAEGPDDRGDDHGPLDCERLGRRLNSTHTPNPDPYQLKADAHFAVSDMVANGAIFHVQHRSDDLQHWTYELPHGGDRLRCRAIIRNEKERGGQFWAAFVDRIIEIGGAR